SSLCCRTRKQRCLWERSVCSVGKFPVLIFSRRNAFGFFEYFAEIESIFKSERFRNLIDPQVPCRQKLFRFFNFNMIHILCKAVTAVFCKQSAQIIGAESKCGSHIVERKLLCAALLHILLDLRDHILPLRFSSENTGSFHIF